MMILIKKLDNGHKTMLLCAIFILLFHSFSNAQTYNSWYPIPTHPDKGMFGGYVRTLAADSLAPNSLAPNTIFAGTRGGGVYRSDDAAERWSESNTHLNDMDVLSIAIDPINNNVLYTGTENGIYKSSDGGSTWNKIGLPGSIVNDIAVDPQDNQIVYAAASQKSNQSGLKRGIWRSTDGGNSWNLPDTLKENNQPVDVYTVYVVIKGSKKKIYVGTSDGLWYSEDGVNWPEDSHDNNLHTREVYCFAVNMQETYQVYAGTDEDVRFSSDYGDTFSNSNELNIGAKIISLAADEQHLFIGTENKGLLKKEISIHKKNYWSTGLSDLKIYSILLHPQEPNTIFCATPDGVYKSVDRGDTFRKVVIGMNSLQVNEHLIDPARPEFIWTATTHGGFYSSDSGYTWQQMQGLPSSNINSLAVNGADVFAAVSDGWVFHSADRGKNWIALNAPPGAGSMTTYSLAVNSVTGELFVGAENGVYMSGDYPDFFKKLDTTSPVLDLLLWEGNPPVIFASTQLGEMYRGSPQGDDWQNVANGFPAFRVIYDVIKNPHSERQFYAGMENGIYLSTNGGAYWKRIEADELNGREIIRVLADPYRQGVLYCVAKNSGVYQSVDAGVTWHLLDQNFEKYSGIISHLTFHPQTSDILIASTRGKGLYQFHAAPEFVFNPDVLNFDSVRVGKSQSLSTQLVNNGQLPMILSDIPVSLDDFHIEVADSIVPSHQATGLNVRFAPQSRNSWSTDLLIETNAHNIDEMLNLQGAGVAPVIAMDSLCKHVGYVATGRLNSCTFNVMNNGDADFEFTASFVIYPDVFSIIPNTGIIPKKSAREFTIVFEPADVTTYTDSLIFADVDSEAVVYGQVAKCVTGEGIQGPGIELSEENIDFDPVKPNDSTDRYFEIRNIGSDMLNIRHIKAQKYPNHFIAEPETGKLAEGEVLNVKVTFTATDGGQFPDELRVQSNATFGDSTMSVSAECVKDRPIIMLKPKKVDFGQVLINEQKVDTVWGINRGMMDLVVSDINYEDDQVFVSDTALTVGQNDSVQILVGYQPNQVTVLRDTLKFVTNAAAGKAFLPLSGASISAEIDMPDTLGFGHVLSGDSAMQELTIINHGTADLTFSLSIQNNDENAFDVTNDSLFIDKDDTILVPVYFSPNPTGEYQEKLLMESDAFFRGDSIVSLAGYCFLGPHLKTDLESLNFGLVLVGDKDTLLIKIWNEGSDILHIDSLKTESVYFNAWIYDNEMESRDTTTISVEFTPQHTDLHKDVLKIYSNAFGDSIHPIPLRGTGSGALIETDSKYPMDYGCLNPGKCSQKPIIVKNIGNADLIIEDIKLASETAVFEIIPNDAIFLPIVQGESAAFEVRFCPEQVNITDINGVQISANALNDSLYEIELRGCCCDREKPLIMHTGILIAEKHTKVEIIATITDTLSGVNYAKLEYRNGGSSEPDGKLLMSKLTGDSYHTELPGDLVTTRGLEYKITAGDTIVNECNWPGKGWHAIRVHVSGDGETAFHENGEPKPQPAGIGVDAYRLFSVPLELEHPDPKEVVADDLKRDLDTRAQKKVWRLADYQNQGMMNAKYVFYNEGRDTVSDFMPGKSFFLIIKDEGKIIDSGPGTSIATDSVYQIPLVSGYNLIANPFNFPIPMNQVKLSESDAIFYLWSYPGEWDTLCSMSNRHIHPWEGYAIYVNNNTTLLVYPHHELLPTSNQNFPVTKNAINGVDWKIQISAENQNIADRVNAVGVSSLASDGYDKFDLPEPPSLGGIKLYFPHPDWIGCATNYAFDIKTPAEEGNHWDFKVTADASINPVKLIFSEFDKVPEEYQIHLIDNDRNVAADVRNSSEYLLFSEANQSIDRSFRLIVGTEKYIAENNLGISSIPECYHLSNNYPNPFNPTTTFCYQLPEMGQVKLHIVNILGQVVKTLVNDEWREAGIHTITWNGRDERNAPVASGIYLCVFSCRQYRQVNKMILLK